jgi:hypothetical protein
MIPSIIAAAIPSVVKLVESAFSKKPKSGSEKFDTAFSAILTIYQALAKSGVVDKSINDDGVRAAIEAVVQTLKQNGELDTPVSGKKVVFEGTIREV